mgnify:CR=1 FL=1
MTLVSALGQIANGGSAVFAIAAAALWFWSAMVHTPDSFPIALDITTSSYDGSSGGTGSSLALSQLGDALKEQSRRSAYAAICAGAAAALQAAALLVSILT